MKLVLTSFKTSSWNYSFWNKIQHKIQTTPTNYLRWTELPNCGLMWGIQSLIQIQFSKREHLCLLLLTAPCIMPFVSYHWSSLVQLTKYKCSVLFAVYAKKIHTVGRCITGTFGDLCTLELQMEARCGKIGHFKGQWKEICVWQLKQTHSERTEAFQTPCVISANSKQTSWIP